jgi:hypothetical protein
LPDPYINVLVHAIRHFSLKQVCLASIVEHEYPHEETEEQSHLRNVVEDIYRMLGELAGGRYVSRSKEHVREGVPIGEGAPIGSEDAAIYRACLNRLEEIENTTLVIQWQDLDKRLQGFSRDGHAAFDVTALKKNLLVDVVVLLLSRGCNRVFDLEILRRGRYFNEQDLIHNLKEGDNVDSGDYIYRNLIETGQLRLARRRMVARSMTFRKLILTTVMVAVIVLITQFFFPSSWAETTVLAASAIAAIATLLLGLLRD